MSDSGRCRWLAFVSGCCIGSQGKHQPPRESDMSDAFHQSEKAQSIHGVLLECLEDKDQIMEGGLENPFLERMSARISTLICTDNIRRVGARYPLPSTSYILLYAESDVDGNDRVCAQLYQSRFDGSIEHVLSQLHLTAYDPLDLDYLSMFGFPQDDLLPSQHPYPSKWDTLAARDEDINEKQRLRQLQRPDFFAKPRPKPVPKKRQTIDLKFLLDRQEGRSSSPKGKRKEQPSTPEQPRKRKTSADTWESENKEMIKKRLWGTMSKNRGHDRRSEKSKLLFHQIYLSCQYVFRRVMKDEQVDPGQLDQVIEKHLEFYEEIDRCL
ncbi:hypothetical protein BJV82DRAFT_364917 [Fennellomyces sp. T-0311]|nr:hypothetical protein BJV82DRAFT_364917 [Fennellomyces sp. T-0311]